jgi:hypothetical protein
MGDASELPSSQKMLRDRAVVEISKPIQPEVAARGDSFPLASPR